MSSELNVDEQRTQVLIAKLVAASDDAMLDAVWEERLEAELAKLTSLLTGTELQTFAGRLVKRGGDEFIAALREAAQEQGLVSVRKVLVTA